MNVGFTIQGSSIQEVNRRREVNFLIDNFILPDRSIAENIVEAVIEGANVSLYGSNLPYDLIRKEPLRYNIIHVEDGNFLIVSAVDFKLELPYKGDILVLTATESKEVSYEDAQLFEKEVEQGLIRIIPDLYETSSPWILSEGKWKDTGIWMDSQEWKDNS